MSRSPSRLGRPALGGLVEEHEHVVEHARAHRAVGADHLDRQPGQLPRRLGRRVPGERHAVLGERHLGDDRQIRRDRPDRLDGEPHLAEVGDRLDDQAIDAALQQPLRLLPEGGERFVGGHGAQGGQVLAQRADGAQDEDVAPHRLPHVAGQARPLAIDLADPALQAVEAELEPVGAECVGLETVGPGGEVLGVDPLDGLAVVEVQDIEAGIERDATGVQHGAHRAVGKQRSLGQALQEGLAHGTPPPIAPEAAGLMRSRSRR
jgi:hypothetical protein